MTGIYGDSRGGFDPDRSLFEQDYTKWKDTPNVEVHDVIGMDQNKLKEILNSDSNTICAWCWSEKTDALDGVIDK